LKPEAFEFPKFPVVRSNVIVGHTAGSLRRTWRYGDSMMVGFAKKSIFDLKRCLPQTHNCYEAAVLRLFS